MPLCLPGCEVCLRASALHATALADVAALMEHLNITEIPRWTCLYCAQSFTLHDMWVHSQVCSVFSAHLLSMGTVSAPWLQIYAPE